MSFQIVIIFGVPSHKNISLGNNLSSSLNLPFINIQSLIRDEIEKNTHMGGKLNNLLISGRLISNHLANSLIKNQLYLIGSKGFILLGYPRIIEQFESLMESLSEFDIKLTVVKLKEYMPNYVEKHMKEDLKEKMEQYKEKIQPILKYLNSNYKFIELEKEEDFKLLIPLLS